MTFTYIKISNFIIYNPINTFIRLEKMDFEFL